MPTVRAVVSILDFFSQIFTIGIGPTVDMKLLYILTGNRSQQTFEADDFMDLHGIVEMVQIKACSVLPPARIRAVTGKSSLVSRASLAQRHKRDNTQDDSCLVFIKWRHSKWPTKYHSISNLNNPNSHNRRHWSSFMPDHCNSPTDAILFLQIPPPPTPPPPHRVSQVNKHFVPAFPKEKGDCEIVSFWPFIWCIYPYIPGLLQWNWSICMPQSFPVNSADNIGVLVPRPTGVSMVVANVLAPKGARPSAATMLTRLWQSSIVWHRYHVTVIKQIPVKRGWEVDIALLSL